jgi:hypothetical protein
MFPIMNQEKKYNTNLQEEQANAPLGQHKNVCLDFIFSGLCVVYGYQRSEDRAASIFTAHSLQP